MPFLHMLPDLGMNYTFNRPLLDGTSPARLKELSAIAPRRTTLGACGSLGRGLLSMTASAHEII